MGESCYVKANYPGFGDIYCEVYVITDEIGDTKLFGRVISEPDKDTILRLTQQEIPFLKVIQSVRCIDTKNPKKWTWKQISVFYDTSNMHLWSKEKKEEYKRMIYPAGHRRTEIKCSPKGVTVTKSVRCMNEITVSYDYGNKELLSDKRYSDVYENLFFTNKVPRCAKCGSKKINFTSHFSQNYNAAKGFGGQLILGTAGALSGLESNSYTMGRCMECGEIVSTSGSSLDEIRFDASGFKLLKEFFDECLSKVEKYISQDNYKDALCCLGMAIYYRLRMQTMLSAEERFDEKNFCSICGENIYDNLILLLDAINLTSDYEIIKKAIVDASFVSNRVWVEQDFKAIISKLFMKTASVNAEIIDINDTFFVFNCPYCGKVYKTSTASKGAYIDCKNCHHSIEIK